MLDNKISHELQPVEVEEIITHINKISDRLPFLIDLTPEEKQLLPRLGDKTQKFVEKTYELARQQSDFLPRSFSVEEMGKDLKLNSQLYSILTALNLLIKKVEDTYIETGSEAYDSALIVYNAAKHSRVANGLEELVEEIGQRFSKKRKKVILDHKEPV